MTGIASWLMVLSAVGPLLGAVVGLILVAGKPLHRISAASANIGILCGTVAAACLAVVIGPTDVTIVRLGTWIELTSPRRIQIDWSLQSDFSTALWVAVISGLAGLNVRSFKLTNTERQSAAFSVSTALVLASTIGLVLSGSLFQMFICWTALSLTTLLMVGWSSPSRTSVQGMRRAVQAGLPGDILLLWVVFMIVQSTGSNHLFDAMSHDGLTRAGTGNPVLPGLIACLLVLSILGRCGLFPWFGWHHEALAWDARYCVVIYGIGYVPSAIWMMLKCAPLLATSEVPLTFLGGIGTLGAVLAAFVACGQNEPFPRLAYLLTSQVGVMMTALGSGADEAVPACVIHQCSLSVAAFVLFSGSSKTFANGRHQRVATWCAVLSMIGLIPFSGGWSQQALVEMNMHRISWRSASELTDDSTIAADVVPTNIDLSEMIHGPAAPQWGWICGLWIAQGLSAYAAVRVVSSSISRTSDSGGRRRLDGRLVDLAAILLLIGGPCGWILGFLHFPMDSEALSRFVIGQSAAIAGLLGGWLSLRTSSANNTSDRTDRWRSIRSLSQHRLYIDQIICLLFSVPRRLAQFLATRLLSSTAIDASWMWITVRVATLFGVQVEALHAGRTDFYIATLLLGTVTLLLTLILVI